MNDADTTTYIEAYREGLATGKDVNRACPYTRGVGMDVGLREAWLRGRTDGRRKAEQRPSTGTYRHPYDRLTAAAKALADAHAELADALGEVRGMSGLVNVTVPIAYLEENRHDD